MRYWRLPILAATLVASLALTGPASAQSSPPHYSLVATIPIPPWFALSAISYDITWVSPDGSTVGIGDRSTGGVAIFDAINRTFVKSAGGGSFVGVAPTGSAGPNGVVWVGPNEWAGGDGNSTLKVVNVVTGDEQSVDTGGTHRVDEMAYDPASDLLMVANDREDVPFVTILKVHPLSITGKVLYPQADGLEQPLVAGNGKFYFAVPKTTANPGGEIDLVNAKTLKVEQVIPTGDCEPTGLAWGIGGTFVTGGAGCVVDPKTGSVTVIDGVAGGDEVATDLGGGVYAFMRRNTTALLLVDANTNKIFQTIPVAIGNNGSFNPVTGELYLPDAGSKSLLVYAPDQ